MKLPNEDMCDLPAELWHYDDTSRHSFVNRIRQSESLELTENPPRLTKEELKDIIGE